MPYINSHKAIARWHKARKILDAIKRNSRDDRADLAYMLETAEEEDWVTLALAAGCPTPSKETAMLVVAMAWDEAERTIRRR